LLYSSGGETEKKVVYLPMKILDDLNVCEQRAILRAEPHLGGQPTAMQELGKAWWRKKAEEYRRMVESLFKIKHVVLRSGIEQSVSLTYVGSESTFLLLGMVDLVIVTSICCRSTEEECAPSTILFEFTMHEHFETVIPRVIAYASALYAELGFFTIPVIVIMKDYENNIVEKFILLLNNNKAGFSITLKSSLKRLENLVSGKIKLRTVSEEICTQCDIDIWRRCPYAH